MLEMEPHKETPNDFDQWFEQTATPKKYVDPILLKDGAPCELYSTSKAGNQRDVRVFKVQKIWEEDEKITKIGVFDFPLKFVQEYVESGLAYSKEREWNSFELISEFLEAYRHCSNFRTSDGKVWAQVFKLKIPRSSDQISEGQVIYKNFKPLMLSKEEQEHLKPSSINAWNYSTHVKWGELEKREYLRENTKDCPWSPMNDMTPDEFDVLEDNLYKNHEAYRNMVDSQ
ncbi:MAG: hypothetical protein GOV00_02210 [Candidatus Altiarchaeota archaeon]|nr:hypothetical protein [Candidatus Altiarchaeota archaeon]